MRVALALVLLLLAGCASPPSPAPPATDPPAAAPVPPEFGFAEGVVLRLGLTRGELHAFRLHAEQTWAVAYADTGREPNGEDYGFLVLPAGAVPSAGDGCVGQRPRLYSSYEGGLLGEQAAGDYDVWYWNNDAGSLELHVGKATPVPPRDVPPYPTGWSMAWSEARLVGEPGWLAAEAHGEFDVPDASLAYIRAYGASGVDGSLSATVEGCATAEAGQDGQQLAPTVELATALGPGRWPWTVRHEGSHVPETGGTVSILLLSR